MECLDKLSSGVRGQTTGADMACSPAISPAMADSLAISMDTLQASFEVLQEVLIPLGPTVRHEQDPNSSNFTSDSCYLLSGSPMHTEPPPSVLRQCI